MIFGFLRRHRERREARRLHEEALIAYQEALMQACSGGAVVRGSGPALLAFRSERGLTREDVHSLHVGLCKALWILISRDARITDKERADFETTIDELDVAREEAGFDERVFNRGIVLASLEAGGAPPEFKEIAGIPVRLGDDEVFHWACPAVLNKWKSRVTRIGYAGTAVSIRIVKGVRYRLGSFKPFVTRSEALEQEDVGALWLSSHRIGFHGNRKSFDFAWSKLKSFEVTEHGLKLTKSGRETPYWIQPAAPEVVCAVADWIINRRT